MFTVICLIGSTRFESKFRELEEILSKKGYIVFSPLVYTQSGEEPGCGMETKKILDQVQLEKIHRSDIVFVVDKDGYIGASTKKQEAYAKFLQKPIFYYSKNDLEKLTKERE